MKLQKEVITPRKAETYLAAMKSNRPLGESKVYELAVLMDQEKWCLNGETIKFNSAGDLIDGQHRLQACVLAKKPFETFVVRGLKDLNAYATIDVGRTRTGGDILAVAGFRNYYTCSAIAYLVMHYKAKKVTWTHVSPLNSKDASKLGVLNKKIPPRVDVSKADILKFAIAHKEQLEEAGELASQNKTGHLLPNSILGACYFLFAEKDRDAARVFLKDLSSGESLKSTDAVYLLRERFISNAASKAKLKRHALFGLAIKAWTKRRQNVKTGTLKFHISESFPEVV